MRAIARRGRRTRLYGRPLAEVDDGALHLIASGVNLITVVYVLGCVAEAWRWHLKDVVWTMLKIFSGKDVAI